MGTNNLETKNPGDVISSADPNQYKTALGQDHVPRNSSGVPTDVAGGLGSTLYRWATSYINKIFFGVAGEQCAIENTGSNLRFLIGNTLKALIDTNGIDGQYMKLASVADDKLAKPKRFQIKTITTVGANGVTMPSDTTYGWASGCGAGGGGGGGGGGPGGQYGDGGGGGGGARIFMNIPIKFTASASLTVTIPAGGTAGSSGGGTGDGGNGGHGGASTITGLTAHPFGAGTTLTFPGGQGGFGGGENLSTGSQSLGGTLLMVSGSPVTTYMPVPDNLEALTTCCAGGVGGSNGADSADGARNAWTTTPGQGGAESANGQGGGGGGGGSGFGAGGDGGDGSNGTANAGTAAPSTNYGAGGGGGGGGDVGAAGAAGAQGIVFLMCLTGDNWEGTV